MDAYNWTLETNKLVAPDEQASALTRFQENILNPAINSAVLEPWNTVVSVTNSISEKLAGSPVLEHKEDLDTGHTVFLSSKWLVQSVSGGLAMLLPYSFSGKAAGAFLENVSLHVKAGENLARVLGNEASHQILGAAIYDGLREAKANETHLGNAAGGVTAFGTFAIGNALAKDLPVPKMLAMRTLAGAIGGSAQHAVSTYLSSSHLPKFEELGKATVNGVVMSLVLPESQRALKSVVHTSNETFDLGVPLDRFFEGTGQSKAVVSHAAIMTEEIHMEPLEHGSYDFFVKAESGAKSSQDRSREEMSEMFTNRHLPTHPFDFRTNISHLEGVLLPDLTHLNQLNVTSLALFDSTSIDRSKLS